MFFRVLKSIPVVTSKTKIDLRGLHFFFCFQGKPFLIKKSSTGNRTARTRVRTKKIIAEISHKSHKFTSTELGQADERNQHFKTCSELFHSIYDGNI